MMAISEPQNSLKACLPVTCPLSSITQEQIAETKSLGICVCLNRTQLSLFSLLQSRFTASWYCRLADVNITVNFFLVLVNLKEPGWSRNAPSYRNQDKFGSMTLLLDGDLHVTIPFTCNIHHMHGLTEWFILLTPVVLIIGIHVF